MPNADVKAEWTENPAGSAFDRLNDTTRADWVETTTVNAITRVDYETVTLGAGEVVVYAEVEVDLVTFGSQIEMSILVDGTVTSRAVLVPTSTDGIYRVGVAAPLTQTQVDGIRFQCVHKVAGTSFVYSAPLKLYTRTDVWDAANAKFRANRNASTGLSAAAGFLGSDIGGSVDLGGGRSLFYGGDAGIATAASQQFWSGTNVSTPAAPRATFVRNIALLLDSYDVEAATFTYTTGAANSPYHPDDGTYGGRWPFKSFIHSGRLFTVGRFSTAPYDRIWVAYTDSFAGAPSTWTWTYLPSIPGFCVDRGNAEFGIWDDGVDKVYMWSSGPGATAPWRVALCRLDTTLFHSGDWRRPEWWTGTTWSLDKPGFPTRFPRGILGRKKPRVPVSPANPAVPITNQGSVTRRSDNKFQLVTMDASIPHGGPGAPFQLHYALTSGTSPGNFGALTAKFVVPAGEPFPYGASYHPQLTWSGMGANDQVWTYSSNWDASDRTWEPLYYTRFVKALSIT